MKTFKILFIHLVDILTMKNIFSRYKFERNKNNLFKLIAISNKKNKISQF